MQCNAVSLGYFQGAPKKISVESENVGVAALLPNTCSKF